MKGPQRVVTIWGAAGIGKTRLAMATARTLDKACFVALADCRTADEVAAEIAGALGVLPGSDPAVSVGRALAAGTARWLVMDNAEQVVDALGALLKVWLEEAPECRVLVTSRERLRLAEEVCLEVPPLALPIRGEVTAAVELLLARVRDTWGEFALDEGEQGQAAELVRRLDGLPLAIELAAPQVDLLGLEGVLKRLGSRLDLLDGGRRAAPDRQATLRGSLDWSWALLDEGLQEALAACGIFRGGFDLAAAQAVLSGNARRILGALRDRSLVRRSGAGRFGLYEDIGAYALERLKDSVWASTVRSRHRNHFLARGERWLADIDDGADARVLAPSRGNLLVVFEGALAEGDGETALRVACVLAPLLLRAGPVSLLVDLLRAGLEHHDQPGPLRARAHQAQGLALQRLGALDQVQPKLEAALEEAEDTRLRGRILKDLGVFHHQQRQLEVARTRYQEAIPLLEASGDMRGVGVARGNVGALLHDAGRYDEAAERYQDAITAFRRLGDPRLEGIFLGNVGVLFHEQDRLEDARTALTSALALLESGGDRRFIAITLGNLGAVSQDQGRLEEALVHHRASLEHIAVVEDAHTRALGLARLGATLAELGRVDEAERALRSAEGVVASGDDASAAAVVALAWAFVEQAKGAPDAVARILDQARAAHIGSRPLVEVSDEARLALRRLDRLQARRAVGRALRVAPGGVAFQAPGGSWRDISRNRMLPRMLEALVAEHVRGRSLDVDGLFAAGWPGERAMPTAAANRVYVALSKLRSQGLEGLLVRDEQGWRLDPDRPIVRGEIGT